MTPKKMNKLLWAGLLLLSVIFLAGLYFANKSFTKLANDTNKLRAETQINQKKLEIYKQSKDKSKSLEHVEDLAQQILPTTHNQSATVAEISQFASRTGLKVADITFDAPSPSAKKNTKKDKNVKTKKLPKGVEAIPMTLSLREGARYDNILEFLKILENNRRKMQVTNISLTPSEENRAIFEQVVFRIHVYVLEDKKDSKDED